MIGLKNRNGFRAIVYKCVDGKVEDCVVSAEDATSLALEGWHLSPSRAHPEEAMRDNNAFILQTDMINTDRMRMINLPMISNKESLEETAKRWLGIRLNRKHNLRSMKQRMIKSAMSQGIWEDSDGNS